MRRTGEAAVLYIWTVSPRQKTSLLFFFFFSIYEVHTIGRSLTTFFIQFHSVALSWQQIITLYGGLVVVILTQKKETLENLVRSVMRLAQFGSYCWRDDDRCGHIDFRVMSQITNTRRRRKGVGWKDISLHPVLTQSGSRSGLLGSAPNIRKGMSGGAALLLVVCNWTGGGGSICAARTLPWKMIIWHLICHSLSFVIRPPPSLDCVAIRRYVSYLMPGRKEEQSRPHNMPVTPCDFLSVFLSYRHFHFLIIIFLDIWRLLSFSAPESGQEVDRAGHSPQRITQQWPRGMCHHPTHIFL